MDAFLLLSLLHVLLNCASEPCDEEDASQIASFSWLTVIESFKVTSPTPYCVLFQVLGSGPSKGCNIFIVSITYHSGLQKGRPS